MERRIALNCLTAHLSCRICRGYLIEATTVTECLHTFCKSCLVKHLEERNTCPQCETLIHQSHPLNYVAYDRTMQDVVYRLVPELQKNRASTGLNTNINRKGGRKSKADGCGTDGVTLCANGSRAFASGRDSIGGTNADDENQTTNHGDCHRMDEQVNLLLESDSSSSLRSLERAFIRVSTQATVTHLKKFLAKKIFNNTSKYNEVSWVALPSKGDAPWVDNFVSNVHK
ncbi:Locus-specific chromosome binding protein-like [Tropilaelaps mercedesae]|uniref:Locus-specific chromosome binding protein-like n=1 Tax=Tropilaelaps mercedesae TaxID=418985 RepID=A0A1V9XW08_9ACAR|nr:Locus-specific chromosome binding protein-like [Tropilaelaps mercedesae]